MVVSDYLVHLKKKSKLIATRIYVWTRELFGRSFAERLHIYFISVPLYSHILLSSILFVNSIVIPLPILLPFHLIYNISLSSAS